MCWPSARNLIDRKVKQIEEQVQRGEKVEGMYLTYLLSSNKLSLPEVYITITELLLGGVDTVSAVYSVMSLTFRFRSGPKPRAAENKILGGVLL